MIMLLFCIMFGLGCTLTKYPHETKKIITFLKNKHNKKEKSDDKSMHSCPGNDHKHHGSKESTRKL